MILENKAGTVIMRIVGVFSEAVIQLLDLPITPGTPILIGEQNIEHIKQRHAYEYDLYFYRIEEIIETPDYVGINPHDHSIGYVKLYEVNGDYVRVAVRVTTNGTYIVRSLHNLSTVNAENYIRHGTLKRLT